MDQGRADQQIGYILRSYPRLTQTFILNEVLSLEALGIHLALFPLAHSGEALVQPGAAKVRASVRFLDDVRESPRQPAILDHLRALLSSPVAYLLTFLYVLVHAKLDSGYRNYTRFENFSHAVRLASLLRDDRRQTGSITIRLHAHFAHDPALVAYLVHRLTGIPYSFTAHARDLYQVPAGALIDRAGPASQVITCCEANLNYLRTLLPPTQQAKIHLIHHGVDLDHLHPSAHIDDLPGPPLILSAGRMVEKKGFSDLIGALAQLKSEGVGFRCRIYGDGPLRSGLTVLIRQLGLDAEVALPGEYTQDRLASLFSDARVFALTPLLASDGDRDGIPNVLIEAMACGIPVVSTAVGGIPELVQPGLNGFLANAQDGPAICAGIKSLLTDPDLAQQMGRAARQTACDRFDRRRSAQRLVDLFESPAEQGLAAGTVT